MYIVYVILITTSLDKWDLVIGVRPVVFVFLHVLNLNLETYNWCHKFNGGKKYVLKLEGITCVCESCTVFLFWLVVKWPLSFDLRGLSWPTFTLITTRSLTWNWTSSQTTQAMLKIISIFSIITACVPSMVSYRIQLFLHINKNLLNILSPKLINLYRRIIIS